MIGIERPDILMPDASEEYNNILKDYYTNSISPNTTPAIKAGYTYKAENSFERSLVDKYSKMYGVDKFTVLGMMSAETGGGVRDSSKGAKGRLQLMPATAAGLARELGMKDYDINDLETNIHFGVRYYKQMLDQFKDEDLAVAAYNAGPTAVRNAKGIPNIKETINHVAKVKRAKMLSQETDVAMKKHGLQYFKIGDQEALLDPDTGSRLAQANMDYFKATGKHIKINSHFRSNSQQTEIYQRSKKEKFRAARPGNSNHERGKAIDVQNWKEAETYLHKYGLINPLSDDKVHFSITGR